MRLRYITNARSRSLSRHPTSLCLVSKTTLAPSKSLSSRVSQFWCPYPYVVIDFPFQSQVYIDNRCPYTCSIGALFNATEIAFVPLFLSFIHDYTSRSHTVCVHSMHVAVSLIRSPMALASLRRHR